MKVYVDDMLMKSKVTKAHIKDLREGFTTLQKYQIKLNPTKCAFRVAWGKFLGFMVSKLGVEANLEKIKAICKMGPPKMIKDV